MRPPSFQPPAWFRVRSPLQADTIHGTMQAQEDVESFQRREMDKAKAAALPMMAELVRELDATSEAQVRGDIRVWTPETYERVMNNRRWRWWKNVWKLCISFRSLS